MQSLFNMDFPVLLIVLVTFMSIPLITCQWEEALIDTGDDQLGKIQGSYAWTMKGLGKVGRKYYWFSGIPYALTDSYTGDKKFQPSQVWEGKLPGDEPFKANLEKSFIYCPQKAIIDLGLDGQDSTRNISSLSPLELLKSYYSREGVERRRQPTTSKWGQEDCLILTISTPKLPVKGSTELLPVLFFIHGGSFDALWGSVFGGQRLLNHDVVLVTINYRLGILSSLNLGIKEAPGNAAIYDCITALQWVQKYIHHFGGDKDRVTISGQSAGAVLATTVFLSPLAKGLFRGVIGDSGSALSVWANENNPMVESLKVVKLIADCKDLVPESGLPDITLAREIVECMKGVSLEDLIQARDDYARIENLEARLGYDAVVPSVQKLYPGENLPLALEETPAEIMKNMRQNNVSLMMGATRHDGSFVFQSTFYDYLVANGLDSDTKFIRNELLAKFLKGVGVVDPTGALLHSLQKTYFEDTANSDDILSKFPGLLDIHTVLGFKAGAYSMVEAHAKMNPSSYYYAFDYKGLFTTYEIAFGVSQVPGGVAHVDDLLYLFQLIPLLTKEDWSVSDRYVKYWVNFVTYGNPNGPGNLDTPFPRYNATDHRFLVINGTDKVGYHCRDSWIGNSYELWRN